MLKSPLEKFLFLILIVTYIVAACLIGGFHHPDEQYQIIHWANFKLGEVSISEMPWEFLHRSDQPYSRLCVTLFSGGHMLLGFQIHSI